jgi:hypothetical protein
MGDGLVARPLPTQEDKLRKNIHIFPCTKWISVFEQWKTVLALEHAAIVITIEN